MTKVIDCKGMLCPKPLIETKKALKESKVGESIEIILDNDTSCKNVLHFLNDNGVKNTITQEGKLFRVHITVPERLSQPTKSVDEYCEIQPISNSKGNYIIVLSSHIMGKGNDDLGKILMKGFLNTVPELNPLPSEIICYNSAVTLAKRNSDTGQVLLKINQLGVKITLCGTCVDFFNMKEELEVGNISNMLYILEKLTSGAKIIQP